MKDGEYIDISNWQPGKAGIVYMIPSPLSTGDEVTATLPPQIRDVCNQLDFFFAENIRTGRRFLSKLQLDKQIHDLEFEELNKHTSFEEIMQLLQPVMAGRDAGMLSEAGCPGVADPGADLAQAAHQMGIRVVPLVGPSSFLLALMASGLDGQAFAFHGYIPIDKQQRNKAIKDLDRKAQQGEGTQIFMETPYRNEKLFQELVRTCHPDTRLCIARDLTGPDEWIKTKSISSWKREKPALHKVPVVFLLGQ